MVGTLAIVDPHTVAIILHFLAVSPCACSNQVGIANKSCFILWHFHKMVIYKPMVKESLHTLAKSHDGLARIAMHSLVDALEDYQ